MSASTNADSENSVPCATPNCGFWGRPSTGNFCSRCYKEKIKAESLSKDNKSAEKTLQPPAPADDKLQVESTAAAAAGEDQDGSRKRKQENRMRCFECQKKLGLTGIECKCGFVFCGVHRDPAKHNCNFDFEALAKEKYNSRLTAAAIRDKIIGEKI